MPADPSWWPPAPGWMALGLLVLVAAAILLFLLVRRHRRRAYRRAALAELAGFTSAKTVRELPALIRRTALSAFDREMVVGFTGEAWLKFLDRTGGTRDFTDGPGRLLIDLAYDPSIAVSGSESEGLVAVTRNWIMNHARVALPGAEVGT